MSSRYFIIHISTHNYAHNHLFIHALNKHLQAAFFFNIKSYKMRNTPKKRRRKKLNDKRYSIKLNVLPLNQIKIWPSTCLLANCKASFDSISKLWKISFASPSIINCAKIEREREKEERDVQKGNRLPFMWTKISVSEAPCNDSLICR